MEPIALELLTLRQVSGKCYRQLFAPLLARYELTQMEMDALLFLANHPQYDTARDLVAIRQLTKSHVSLAVDKLTRRGWLARCPDPDNGRIQHLRILPPAQPAIAAGQQLQARYAASLLAGIPAPEQAAFRCTLQKILANARQGCTGPEETKEK